MSKAMWCANCTKCQPTERTDIGHICCTGCGKILDEDIYSNEATFVKDASGLSRLSGNYVKSVQSEISASRQRTLDNVYDLIFQVATSLGIEGGDQIVSAAVRYYTLALERNFTRGRGLGGEEQRKPDQVAACCLYIECRVKNKPYLLIEFSEYLQTNVYVLGAVFLQLCRFLHLEDHLLVQKPVDPSLFIHRFTNILLGGEMDHAIEKTALRIMASMKQNWMQTGRKPSGLFGAALYISALSHGRKFTKSDVGRIVHVCQDTLRKRLIEFEDTDSGSLTIEELNEKAEELERMQNKSNANLQQDGELLCKHKEDKGNIPHFAHGLCQSCYEEFVEISGGLDGGGADPPAFQRAEKERMFVKAASTEEELLQNNSKVDVHDHHIGKGTTTTKNLDFDAQEKSNEIAEASRDEDADYCTTSQLDDDDDEPVTFGDIDDEEVEKYFYTEEEKPLVKVIWEEVNREYVQEQEAKEAAAKAAYEAEMTFLRNCTPEELAKRDLAATVAANVAKLKEQRRKNKPKMEQPKTAGEAVVQTFKRKKLSSKVNEDALKNLLDGDDDMDNNLVSKRTKVVSRFQSEDVSVMSTISEDVEAEGSLGDWDGQDEYHLQGSKDDYNYDMEFNLDGADY